MNIKKIYQTPALHVVTLELGGQLLLNASPASVSRTTGNADLNYGGGTNSVSARVKGNTVDWDDDWSE